MEEKPITEFGGAADVVAHFGRWPSFHDAEIVHLHLNRSGESVLRVHVFRMTDQVDERGYYILDKHALLDLHLGEVETCELRGFNSQNVIDSIRVYKSEILQISIFDIWGLSGSIQCQRLRMTITPGKPREGVYVEK